MIAWKFCDQKNSITIHSPDFSLVFFFSLIESEISEKASPWVETEEPEKGF